MILEMAFADAYAIGWEFCDNDSPVDFAEFVPHPKYKLLKPGQYTDDTQRTISTARVILSGDPFSSNDYLNSLFVEYKKYPRAGYSKNFQKLLDGTSTVESFRQNLRRTAESNGSLMGVAPVGYLPNIQDVKLAAGIQAMSTHNPLTIPYAQAIGLMIHAGVYGLCSKDQLVDFVFDNVDWIEDVPVDLVESMKSPQRIGMDARSTFGFVMANFDKPTILDIIETAITYGGDTDSTASLAVGVGSVWGADCSIPDHLMNRLETPDYLIEWDDKLKNYKD